MQTIPNRTTPNVITNSAILAWEPHEGLRESLKLILEDCKRLVFVDSLDQALDFIGSYKVDLVILNADNPISSIGRIKSIKQKFPDTKILLLATHFELESQEEAIRLGPGISFLEKPFKSSELSDLVETLIRGYALEKHTYILKIKRR